MDSRFQNASRSGFTNRHMLSVTDGDATLGRLLGVELDMTSRLSVLSGALSTMDVRPEKIQPSRDAGR